MVATARGTLYVVSTPIGNMGDFSFRAVEILKHVAMILAEDTRHSGVLLRHYGIAASVTPCHEHNEASVIPRVLEELGRGAEIALISDAGTPLLSDPGERVVRAAIAAGHKVVPIPGASAVLAAVVASGLPSIPFTFHGFLPRKGRDRGTVLEEIAASRGTSVFFEAPGRLADTLAELAEQCGGERGCAVARELTKVFEEVHRGTLRTCAEYYHENQPRGEVVVVVAPAPEVEHDQKELARRAGELRAQGLSTRDVVRVLVQEHGAPRNLAYRLTRGK